MTQRVYIIGTSHSIQMGSEKADQETVKEFGKLVLASCQKYQIDMIFEEAFQSALKEEYNVDETVCQKIPASEEIEVKHIDLDLCERRNLSIEDPRKREFLFEMEGSPNHQRDTFNKELVHVIREHVWVARMIAEWKWPALFVCGADHVAAVAQLIRRCGIEVEVIDDDFGG